MQNTKFLMRNYKKKGPQINVGAFLMMCRLFPYLFTWNFVSPSLKKALICLAAAIPALILASAV